MNLISHPTKHLLLAAAALAATITPGHAQQAAPKWRPIPEMIVVSANPIKNWQGLLTGTHFSSALSVSASLSVPYGDLNLTRTPDADELDRRINVAASLVCRQLDMKYPESQYPKLAGDDCFSGAVQDGLARANLIIAAARK
jgi:UrcA family protein